ncbi:MAG: hypothetical protein ABI690_35525 [Chloroflexota bacterium]
MKYIWIVLTVILLAVSVGHAQDEQVAPEGAIFTFTNATYPNQIVFSEAEWQADSRSFRFYMQERGLFQYLVASNELRITDPIGGCVFSLSDIQMEAYSAIGCPTSISPNKKFIVYPTTSQTCGEGCSQVLAVGDLESGQFVPIRKGEDAGYFVRWSEDSSAFLLFDYPATGSTGGIWYESVPESLFPLGAFLPVLVANFGLGDIGYVDLSPDGRQVLIRGNGTTKNGFTLWNEQLPASDQQFRGWADGQHYLENELIAGASFIPNDPQHLLVIVSEGLVRFDLETGEMEVINPAINTQWVDWAYFSPDLDYVLVYDRFPGAEGGQQISLFPIDLIANN